jgi:membrane protein DedA with SNARE-associated domain
VSEARLGRAERWFDRHDRWAVLLGTITPFVRSFVAIPAGLFRVPVGRFVLWATIGSLVFAFAFTGIGYAVGSHYERIHRFVDLALLAGAAALVLYLVFRWFSRLKSRRA